MKIEFEKTLFKITVSVEQVTGETDEDCLTTKGIMESIHGKDLRGALSDAYNIIMKKIDKLDGTDRNILPKKKDVVLVS